MKKLIVGLMGLILVGAMSLPVAAQGRRSNRDSQTTTIIRRDNTQRNDFGFSRRNNDQRDNRYDTEQRTQNQYDNYDRRGSSQQWNRQGVRINAGTFLNLLLRH